MQTSLRVDVLMEAARRFYRTNFRTLNSIYLVLLLLPFLSMVAGAWIDYVGPVPSLPQTATMSLAVIAIVVWREVLQWLDTKGIWAGLLALPLTFGLFPLIVGAWVLGAGCSPESTEAVFDHLELFQRSLR